MKQQQSSESELQRSSSKCVLPQLRRFELLPGPKIGDFGLLQVLGVGQSGKVVLAQRNNQSARQFALKMMRKTDVIAKEQVARVHMERQVLEMMNSPFITRLHYSFQVRQESGTNMRQIPPPQNHRAHSHRC